MDRAPVYVLNSPLIAVKLDTRPESERERGALERLPAGAELVYNRPAATGGAVRVLWNREEYMIFTADLETRASERSN